MEHPRRSSYALTALVMCPRMFSHDGCPFFFCEKAGSGDKLPDEKCIAILRKMSKQQQESIDMYRKGERDDLVEKETKTKELIDAMLPQV